MYGPKDIQTNRVMTNGWTNIPSYSDVIDVSGNDDFQKEFTIALWTNANGHTLI